MRGSVTGDAATKLLLAHLAATSTPRLQNRRHPHFSIRTLSGSANQPVGRPITAVQFNTRYSLALNSVRGSMWRIRASRVGLGLSIPTSISVCPGPVRSQGGRDTGTASCPNRPPGDHSQHMRSGSGPRVRRANGSGAGREIRPLSVVNPRHENSPMNDFYTPGPGPRHGALHRHVAGWPTSPPWHRSKPTDPRNQTGRGKSSRCTIC